MSGKHGRNRLGNYLSIHSTVMHQWFDHGFVVGDELVVTSVGDGTISMKGAIRCLDGLSIDVEKYLVIHEGDAEQAIVQTFVYTYDAHIDKLGNVFRYCSPHPDHHTEHHVHRYDVFGPDPSAHTVTFIPEEDDRPTLGDVIEEFSDWYYQNHDAVRALLARQR